MGTGTKHTPGPWSVGTFRSSKTFNADVPVHVGTGATRGNALALVVMGGPGATRSGQEELEANARLIAAAPDLLAALKDVLFATKGSSGILDRAREAVAKAEGSR